MIKQFLFNDPRRLPRNQLDFIILNIYAYDNFVLPDE